MKRRITTILLVVLLIAGFGMILYPWASNAWERSSQTRVIEEYDQAVSVMDTKEIDKAKNQALQYDLEHNVTKIVDPFAQAGEGTESGSTARANGSAASPSSYGDILNVGEAMGYVEIPKIEVDIPIYHGTGDAVMVRGAGHMEGTSSLVGGEGTHCVIAAHSGLKSAKMFTDLDKLETGDKFYIHILDEVHTYQVDEIHVVLPDDTEKLQIVPGKDYVTLLTCTPYGTNTHRLLVRGTRIPNDDEAVSQEIKSGNASVLEVLKAMWWVVPLIVVLIVLIFWCFCRRRKRHQ